MVAIPPSLYFLSPDIKRFAEKLIEKELSYLKLDKQGVSSYINDYFGRSRNDVISNMKWKLLYYGGYNSYNSNKINDLLKYYLLSTDFFLNRMDTTKPVNYLGMFDHYKSAIPNPFSYLLLPNLKQ